MREPASYIRAAGVLDAPTTFPWKGSGQHYGEPEGTKLHKIVSGLTVTGVAALAAGVQEWILWRLQSARDVARYLDHVDAAWAWTIDIRYKVDDKLRGEIPKDTPVNSALRDAVWMLRLVTNDKYWEIPEPSRSAVSLASIARQIMPPKAKKAFEGWLAAAAERVSKLAKAPQPYLASPSEFASKEEYFAAGRPYFGEPIPREALDPAFDYKPELRKELLSRFLDRLDWQENPFLRSPEELAKQGFSGEPYRLP